MANELRLTINFAYEQDGNKIDKSVANLGVDVALSVVASGVQEIGTSEEALGLNGVVAGGFVYMKNLDDANFVELRSGTGATDVIRLMPGEPALFRLSPDATAPFMIADTAACEVEYVVLSA